MFLVNFLKHYISKFAAPSYQYIFELVAKYHKVRGNFTFDIFSVLFTSFEAGVFFLVMEAKIYLKIFP